jgi:hypothetical protein
VRLVAVAAAVAWPVDELRQPASELCIMLYKDPCNAHENNAAFVIRKECRSARK